MKPVTIIHHPDCALHDTGGYHPERPERTSAIVKALKSAPFAEHLRWQLAEPAAMEWIEAVHDRAYVRQVEEACLRGDTALDRGDTQVSVESFAVARLAAGAAMQAVDAAMQDDGRRAFSVMRPPGHHAEHAEAMGFCLFNNVAVAARYAQRQYGLQRVAIVDFDVHHGNGTQSAFYDDPSVFFVSFHQYPFYPGTGMERETGNGQGEGYTLNIPLLAGADYSEFAEAWSDQALPALEKFKPELLLISAGFDAHIEDPLANLKLGSEDYGLLTKALVNFAAQSCRGRVVSVLEGGYNLSALASSAQFHVRSLCDIE